MKKLNNKLIIFLLILVVVGSVIISIATPSNYLIDDAFITFRYSRNISNGQGITWNQGGEHTQGYTNFLFVLLISLGFGFNADPIKFALLLNTIGLILIQTSIFLLLREKKAPIYIQLLCPLLVGVYSATTKNINSGLETVFWTGLIFISYYYLKKPNTKNIIILYILLFIATLTRPEGIIFAIIWTIILLFNKEHRKTKIISFLFYALLICGYLLFNLFYFGYIEPNSALVKISRPWSFPGIAYLSLTMIDNQLLFGLFLITTLTSSILKKSLSGFVYSIPFYLLIPFYLMTDPYMGTYGRYYFPLIIYLILKIGVDSTFIQQKIKESNNYETILATGQKYISPSKILLFLTSLSMLVLLIQAFEFQITDKSEPFDQALLNKEIEIGQKLAKEGFVNNIVFAYGDAGSIPYYSDVNFLDIVGLNSNSIAKNGKSKGGEWVVEYVLNESPDIIGFYSWKDGYIYNNAHGFIGSYYSSLYQKMMKNDGYQYLGSFDCEWIIINFFVNNQSRYKNDIKNFYDKITDVQLYDLKP